MVANTFISDVQQNFAYLEKAVSNFDPKYTLQVLRGLPALRKRITSNVLVKVIESAYPVNEPSRKILLSYSGAPASSIEDDSMDVDEPLAAVSILPEVDIFLHLLVQVWLLNQNEIAKLKEFNDYAIQKLQSYNRRSLDYLAAKVWFYYSRAKELLKESEETAPLLLAALRTATLRHDTETQASLITLLLRNYLLSQQVTKASNLVAKTVFPDSAGNALVARYFYYLGRIRAIQLDYSAAHEHITAAIRKAPQTQLAGGFLQTANKLNIVIELLMGDIPERSVFKQPLFGEAACAVL